MEEEGIFDFFKFSRGSHKLVLANTPSSHPDINDESTLIYEELSGGVRKEERVASWQKVQGLALRQVYALGPLLLDSHSANTWTAQSNVVDKRLRRHSTHRLKVSGNDSLEIYEHPGLYAQRFDGIDKSGSPQPSEVQKIFEENKRTVGIRMQQTENPMLLIHGSGNCRQMAAGYRFTR